MNVAKYFLLLGVVALSTNKCYCRRSSFKNCRKPGFMCSHPNLTTTGKLDVTYECQTNFSDVQLWQFLGPIIEVGRLTIKNCNFLRLHFESNVYDTNIQGVHVENVANLEIFPTVTRSRCPQSLSFKNVKRIEKLPSEIFTQDFKSTRYTLDSIAFENVVIGTIESKAFGNLTRMKFFRWESVTVGRIETEAVQISCQNGSSIHILDCVIDKLDYSAFQVTTDKMFVVHNKFQNIPPSAFKGNLQRFDFSYNCVDSIHMGAFDIEAEEVYILGNSFEHIHLGAFQKIGHDTLYVYRFCQNFVKHVDFEALHLEGVSNNGVNAEVNFSNNLFHCTCDDIHWAELQSSNFGQILLDPSYNNNCAFAPCHLPLMVIEQLWLSSRICHNITVLKLDEVCRIYSDERNLLYPDSSNTDGMSRWSVIWLLLQSIASKWVLYYYF